MLSNIRQAIKAFQKPSSGGSILEILGFYFRAILSTSQNYFMFTHAYAAAKLA